MTLILHLAIDVPLYHHFDYLPPDNTDIEALKPGIRLRVPWGKREAVGVLISVSTFSPLSFRKLKKALEILDNAPLFSETLLALIQFGSKYYHYPIGEVFASAMPLLLRQGKMPVYRQNFHTDIFEELPEAPFALGTDQISAVEIILEKAQQFQPFLLFGVTGSGKTEIYLQVIEKLLAQQKQALVLVPEIGLTPQTVSRFEKRFLVNICVLHSGLTEREKYQAWMDSKTGQAQIIIGTRSAVFIPLINPGVIILDEEHDISFKQQEGFRYSARDLAVRRAQLENIPVILGSATPSIESFYNVMRKRYILLTLPKRAGNAVSSIFKLIDLKNQPRTKNSSCLSVPLVNIIQTHLSQQGQVLIFLNRRGFSPVLICHHCGWIADCKRCDARMTLHQSPAYLQCHHCLTKRAVDKICLDCGEKNLCPVGTGTERLEENLTALFPDTPIIRIDRDTTKQKGTLKRKLNEIHAGKSCILVGTQMLAKGHHFPLVTLSVIINADSGLFSADFRGLERTGQLILQVAGRAGRMEKQGEVVLQTYHPEHPLLNVLLEKGYAEFAGRILEERSAVRLSPYEFLCLIRAESVDIQIALDFLSSIKALLFLQGITLGGPIPALMQKKAGKHRAQLLLQSPSRKKLQQALDYLIANLFQLKFKQRVRWSLDVDPLEMF